MAEGEQRHLARFDTLLRERHVRPTLLHPLWTVAGYVLGAATALLGERAAMACTVAVEEVIDEHYRDQAERIGDSDPALRDTILSFRDDEIAHRDIALAQGAEETPGYDLISGAVKTGSPSPSGCRPGCEASGRVVHAASASTAAIAARVRAAA